MKIKLGIILIKLRKEKNLTQHEIANALYVNNPTCTNKCLSVEGSLQ